MLSPQWLDELRARVTLSSVIMRTTKLQKAGREWKACCPFHNEKSPSFTVSDEKGFYHCFGCGAHGDVIRWMTDQRGLQFMDAVKELAQEAGMEVPAPDPQSARIAEKQASLIDVTEASQQWFVEQLQRSEGSKARDYLASRGFSDSVIREFGFGYAPGNKQAIGPGVGFEDAMLVESGMRIETEDGRKYDRFRDRLMLPIQDARGRVIAFGGRILDKRDGVAKYLNSPETPLFDKGRTLYNLHRALPASRVSRRMIVVEGYMDVVSLANVGIHDAVAPLGTALTERQLERLWRTVERPILCFDGDAAGARAAKRAIERALPHLRPSRSLMIATLPKDLDPDDIVSEGGAKAFEGVLDGSENLINAIWRIESSECDFVTPEEKAGLKRRLEELANSILDPDIRRLYRSELIDRFWKTVSPFQKRPHRPGTDDRSAMSKLIYWMQNPDIYIEHLQSRLGASIAAGLMYWPEKISEHSDELGSIDPSQLDRRIDLALDFFGEDLRPEPGAVAELYRESSKGLPHKDEWDGLWFTWTRPEYVDATRAKTALDEAIKWYVRYPLIKFDIQKATEQFEAFSEGAFGEQQRILRERDVLKETMATLLADAFEQSRSTQSQQLEVHA